ncbi:MAG: ATP-binding protein [Faecousia sp.]
MLKKLMHSTRWRFILCVMITNLLSSILTVFVWVPVSRSLFPEGHVLAPYMPMVIATLAAIPISSAVSLHSAKPIQDMLEATKSISKGDYSVRVPEEGEGDLGELLRSFNQMTAELGSTELMRNDFINTFSHEFKTPIVSIRGFARRLRSGNLTQRQREEYLQFIAEESERLSNLSSSVLLIAKYENQNLVTEQTSYDLDEQIRTCILRLEGQWSAKKILFDLDMPRLPYRSNPEMMDHVWLNLIGNAVKFSYEGGTIHIHAKNENSHITVWIRDEGIGIQPEHIGHIFDKFYQEDTAHASEGNGLGLALVHRILELVGGEIQAESREGQGATFCVRLPRVPAPQKQTAAQA